MGASCHDTDCCLAEAIDSGYRKVLWVALSVNAAMFAIEIAVGVGVNSAALLADAIDFFGDAANYGISLWALSMASIWRSRTALAKGLAMGSYGLIVLAVTAGNLLRGAQPEPVAMGTVGFLALAANLGVAGLLYRFRTGDANMRSVWLCTRNDVIGNLAILLAAVGVFGTRNAWPDLAVAAIMATLGITAAVSVIRHALAELKAAGFRVAAT